MPKKKNKSVRDSVVAEDSQALFVREKRVTIEDADGLKVWYDRITDLTDWLGQHHWNGWKSWRAAYELDRLIHWASKKMDDQNLTSESEDISKITVPLIANHIRNLVPFLYVKDPTFYAMPSDPKNLRSALAQMDYLNYAWREYKMGKQVKKAILDAAIIGHGICKTGWNLELYETDNLSDKGILTYQDYIKRECPFVRRVNPFLFFFDRFSPEFDLASARWCGELIVMPIQDIVDCDLFDKELRNDLMTHEIEPYTVEQWKTAAFKNSGDDQTNFLFSPKHGKGKENEGYDPTTLALIYEIHDKKFNQIITLLASSGSEKIQRALRVRDNPHDYLNDFVYEKVDFEEVPNEPYGIGHARYLIDIQKQINRSRNKMYAITRMFNPKWYHSGPEPLAESESQKLKSDIPGDVINGNPGSTLVPLQTPTISSDLYQMSSILDKDFSELSGDDILTRGGLLPSRTSAEEVRERARLRGLRLETNVQNTYEFTLNIGRKIVMHAQKYLEKETAVYVIGRPGVMVNTVRPRDMESYFNLDMSIISKTADTPDVIAQKFQQLFTLFTNPNFLQLLAQYQIPIDMGALVYKYMETLGVSEIGVMMPGYSGFQTKVLPENYQPYNTGNQTGAGAQPTTPESTREIQSDNVDPNSSAQGIEGIMAQMMGGQQGM